MAASFAVSQPYRSVTVLFCCVIVYRDPPSCPSIDSVAHAMYYSLSMYVVVHMHVVCCFVSSHALIAVSLESAHVCRARGDAFDGEAARRRAGQERQTNKGTRK